ncbi:MAG: hypothetical protein Q7U83_00020 [Daejeonella sp.]|nr:hypothetical protein [Daejeonella sp.]
MKIHTSKRGKKNTGSADAEQVGQTGIAESKLKQENNTGLPDNLKSGIENLSGYSMDEVKVHYILRSRHNCRHTPVLRGLIFT